MEYYGNNDWRDYLAHYGVKGMKWKNHKYLKKIGEFYDYNITGQGYLRDADRYSARARAARKRADYALDSGRGSSNWYRSETNARIAGRNRAKAERSYTAYKRNSLVGRLTSKKTPKEGGYEFRWSGSKHTGYDPSKSKYGNLSEMNSARRKLKARQAKEKAKATVSTIKSKTKSSYGKAKNKVSKVLSRLRK